MTSRHPLRTAPSRRSPARRTVARALGLCLGLCVWAGCTAYDHARSTAEVTGRSLDVATPEGARRLALETAYDSSVGEIVQKMGKPQWIHVASRDQIYLYYLEKDQLIAITRPMVPPGEILRYGQIPGYLLKLLPDPVVASMLGQREARSHSVARKHKTTRRAPRRAAPASIAPRGSDGSMTLHEFDPDRVVRRLRTPLSAADAGITSWRRARTANGETAHVALAGSTRYVVQSRAVSVSASIGPRGRTASSRARHAIHRVNAAVFGTHVAAVDRRIEPFVARVAADTSGRTRVSRRVAGRTVSLSRDPERGVLVYSVHSE